MSAETIKPAEQFPTFHITPPSRWASIGFRELWDYREPLYFLTWRDIKVRYKQTAQGAAWAGHPASVHDAGLQRVLFVGVVILLLVGGPYYFRRMEQQFADVV